MDKIYGTWRERYAPPVVRMKSPFIAAADQAARYGRQIAELNSHATPGTVNVFNAWQEFIAQFSGNKREVLTRTFWQAFYN